MATQYLILLHLFILTVNPPAFKLCRLKLHFFMVAPKMPKKLIFLSVFFLSLPLLGHHNYRLRFNNAREISMEGTVASFEWKNPHLEISLDVENDQGETEHWILPTAAPRVAQNNGLGPETVVVGDEITVLGWLARDGSNAMRARKLTLKDGRSFSLTPMGMGMGRGMAARTQTN